jgi:hypothetical protein
MLEGSYNWDGTCSKKYLWGLIKTTRGCGGYIVGFVEKNKGKKEILIKYPKTENEKLFQIQNNSLVLEYDEKIR